MPQNSTNTTKFEQEAGVSLNSANYIYNLEEASSGYQIPCMKLNGSFLKYYDFLKKI